MTYILMKSSRHPGNETAQSSDAYKGPSCDECQIKRGQVYEDLNSATQDAICLNQKTGLDFNIWEVNQTRPLASTGKNNYYHNFTIPEISTLS